MSIITYCSVAVAAVYINVSFIIQIALFENIQNRWLDFVGLDSFNSDSDRFAENVSGYAITVVVYIVCLIYLKAASRSKIKTMYMREKYPEKVAKAQTSGLKFKAFRKKKAKTRCQTFKTQVMTILKNPYLHLMVFRLCCFGWIFLYFSFQSLVPLFLLCHSVVYKRKEIFLPIVKYFYIPALWLIFFFHYIVNIHNLFSESIFKSSNYRFGIFKYNPAFIHLLYQIFSIFYGCFTLYLFREYDKFMKRKQEAKEKREKRKLERLQRNTSEASSRFQRAGSSFAEESIYAESQLAEEIYTYEIIFRYILKNIDIALMIVLYIAGVNRIDVYHMILLILFAVYIMYPDQFRRNFIFLLYFMIFIASVKYFYVLFLPEFRRHKTLNDVFLVLGLATDIEEGRKYGQSNLFNNNYLVVLTGFIQYRLYTSDYSKSAFSETQASKDITTFSSRYPRLTAWITVLIELIQLSIPWITYVIFITIAVVNNKALINWVLLTMTLILFFWHISADLVTTKSHIRLKRGWTAFTLIAAACFLIIIIFQILSLDPIANLTVTQNVLDAIPAFIRDNHKIIGLEDYTDFTVSELAVKFLAYVAYFNLSVITRRQFIRSSKNVANYEQKPERIDNPDQIDSNPSAHEDDVLEAKFSLVFIVYKLKKFWRIFDIIAWNTFTLLTITIVLLTLNWKLSVVSAVYVCITLVYYVLIPFSLQPDKSKASIEKNSMISAQDLKDMKGYEDKHAVDKTVALKNTIIVVMSLFTIVCICALHLSANLQILKVNYPDNSNFWENVIFLSFFAGVNYNEQLGGNSYFYEIVGFLAILFACAIERKSEIWLSNKFGYEGSMYDTFEGRIILEKYGSVVVEDKDLDKAKSANDLEIIEEENDEEVKHTTPARSNMEKLLSSEPPEIFISKSQPGFDELEEEKEIKDKFEKEKRAGVRRLISMELWL